MSMSMTEGRMPEKTFGDEERARPAVIASMLSRDRDDLGTGVRVTSVVGVDAAVPVAPLTPAERREAADAGITERNALSGVARSLLAAAEDKPFKRDYVNLGFMLAREDKKPERHAQMIAQMRAASPEEMSEVIIRTAERREALTQRETRMRVEQYLKNDPAVAARLADLSGGKTTEGNLAAITKEFGHMDFKRQREVSMRDGEVVMNSNDDKNAIAALGRGFAALSAHMQSLGLHVPVNQQGRPMGRASKAEQYVPRGAEAPRRRVRDGSVVGGMDI